MAIEIKPVGVACNLRCSYCYQTDQRNAENTKAADDEMILNVADGLSGPIALFGGEPLLLSLPRLRTILGRVYARQGGVSIQSNGALITLSHIELFKEFNVSVGLSVDGPGDLNRWRPAKRLSGAQTSLATMRALRLLLEHNVPVSVIVTLTSANTTDEARPILVQWIAELVELGVHRIRLHLLEMEPGMNREMCPDEMQLWNSLQVLQDFERQTGRILFDLFAEMEQLLLGNDSQVSCVWHACDSYATAAVTGIESDGSISNCGRTVVNGRNYMKAERVGFVRALALLETPMEDGGCKDCRFFLACKGYCPGTAVAKDWRNKTEHCGLLTQMFVALEKQLIESGKEVVSTSVWRRRYEEQAAANWRRGQAFSLSSVSRHQKSVSW